MYLQKMAEAIFADVYFKIIKKTNSVFTPQLGCLRRKTYVSCNYVYMRKLNIPRYI